MTGRKAGLISCHTCHLICPCPDLPSPEFHQCPRCGTRLRVRKTNSIPRCWALVLASFILYLPANLVPITTTTVLGRPSKSDTIMSGVIYFLDSGSWYIALIIFIASVVVPLMKLFILTFLLTSLHFGWDWLPLERTRLFRLSEVVGRWSMVDIYVVTILVALVRFGAFANIEAGPGAAYFAALVILTMFAAEIFDPRLIWDRMEDHNA
ncbi:MAG: paraquat-inducible protein A [Desulfobulbaceae bacterium]|nr:paraquat-inducible protein A [Desulfobulbaceae bacterium]